LWKGAQLSTRTRGRTLRTYLAWRLSSSHASTDRRTSFETVPFPVRRLNWLWHTLRHLRLRLLLLVVDPLVVARPRDTRPHYDYMTCKV
jgi:hypothetical protein